MAASMTAQWPAKLIEPDSIKSKVIIRYSFAQPDKTENHTGPTASTEKKEMKTPSQVYR